MTLIQAYDGKDGWKVSPFQGRKDPEKLSADDCKSLVEDADIAGPLVDWKEKGSTVSYVGTEDVEGTEAYKLKVVRKNGDVSFVYLDPDHFLDIRILSQRVEQGAQIEVETDLGDYEKINGVFLPFSIESGPKNSPDKQKIVLEKAEANVPVDDAMFHFPARLQNNPIYAFFEFISSGCPLLCHRRSRRGKSPVFFGHHFRVERPKYRFGDEGGRVSAIAATPESSGKVTLFVGAASGGVWKSDDSGTRYHPVFDQQPVQSIGAIALIPRTPRKSRVGTGESWTRNSVSIGNGIYKSTDGGETWTHTGLDKSERIAKIAVDPRNSDTVFAAVPGALWSDSPDRGLYKTTDEENVGPRPERIKSFHRLFHGCDFS